MFTTIIIQPIFNLLVLIYNLLPGHNFGLAVIVFTIIIRLLMWPLVKKQLHHAKAIRELTPELKKIKAAAGGDRQQVSKMTMELYKERQINPFASIGIVLVQAPILIGLYFAIQRLIKDPQEIINFSYNFLHFGWLDTLASNIHQFDSSLFGLVDLTRSALGPKGLYWPALVIVALSAVVQFVQSKQLMPTSKDARGLKTILSEAGQGKQADQSEVNAAVGRGMLFLIPFFVFIFGLNFPAALPLYWLVSSAVALIQQSKILKADVLEAEAVATNAAVVVSRSSDKAKNKEQRTKNKKQRTAKNKRRRR
ncbi:MAG: YidC/Oxa1 family membrane protein insertase [Patescibacteria group bacterium]